MAWTVHKNTPLLKSMSEDASAVGDTRYTTDIDTTGYDKMIWSTTVGTGASLDAKVEDNPGGGVVEYKEYPADSAVHVASTDAFMGYCTALPETCRLADTGGGALDIGFVSVELRRTVTHDRGRG